MASRRSETEFTALYQANYRRVLAFVARRVANGSDAEDVTAEVFRTAWTRWEEGVGLTPGWIFVTARNILRNHCRSQQHATALYREAASAVRTRAATHTQVEAVRYTLAVLPEHHATVLTLRYWDRLTSREIADLLELSVTAVWVRLHRARHAFRAAYQRQETTDD